jgi:hypothetical protein
MSLSNLYQALAKASASVAPLTEDGRAEYGGGGYDYISAPGAVRALKPVLLAEGLLPTITGTCITEAAGKQVVVLNCLLVHLESGESLRDTFSLPTAPSRGRDDGKAAQAAITSGLGRWLRCLLLAVQAGEDEIDTARPESRVKAEPLTQARPQGGDLGRLAAMAEAMGVRPDEAVMWATRNDDKVAVVFTASDAATKGILAAGLDRLKGDFETAKTRGMTLAQFGETVVGPWVQSQIPY